METSTSVTSNDLSALSPPVLSPSPMPLTLRPGLTKGLKADLEDTERAADREAVAMAMVMDLTKATVPHDQPPTLMMEGQLGLEDTAPPKKKQRKKPLEDEKVCRVCGDKALAHNFDAITCESCKAFFRRNALRTERNPCMFRGECPITVQTRRFCPACRLRKCFEVGMRADLILDDRERKARMEKVSENRAKRVTGGSSDDTSDSQVGSSCQPLMMTTTATDRFATGASPASTVTGTTTIYVPNPMQEGDCELPQSRDDNIGMRHLQTSISNATSPTVLHLLTSSGQRVTPFPVQQHHQTLQQHLQPEASPFHHQRQQHHRHSSLSSPEPPFAPGAAHAQGDFQHVSRDLLPSDPHMYWRLSEEEKTLLTQLSSAYQDTIMTLPEREPYVEGGGRGGISPRTIESIFETGEQNLKQLVTFVQRLGDFHMLRQDDKIAIIQASGMRTVVLRWVGLYVVERDAWLGRFGENTVATASALFGHEDIIRRMADFCRSVKMILKNDVTLYVLMHCLIMFDPREPNIVDRQLINTFRDKYVILLKHYLESEYSFLYSERYLRAIMDKTVEIRSVAEQSIAIMRQFKDFIPPFTKELLNIHDFA